MWPPGHAAVGYLCYSLGAERARLPDLTFGLLAALAVGTQFPDLVDKPLAWGLGVLPGGRTLAHSLVFLLPFSLLAVGVLARFDRTDLAVAFGVGAVSHVLVDAVPALWMAEGWWQFLAWPLLEGHIVEEGEQFTILGMLRNQVTQPWFLLEYVLVGLAALRWRSDGLPGVAWLRKRREGGDAPIGR